MSATTLSETYGKDRFLEARAPEAISLFLLSAGGKLRPEPDLSQDTLKAGDTVFSLVPPEKDD